MASTVLPLPVSADTVFQAKAPLVKEGEKDDCVPDHEIRIAFKGKRIVIQHEVSCEGSGPAVARAIAQSIVNAATTMQEGDEQQVNGKGSDKKVEADDSSAVGQSASKVHKCFWKCMARLTSLLVFTATVVGVYTAYQTGTYPASIPIVMCGHSIFQEFWNKNINTSSDYFNSLKTVKDQLIEMITKIAIIAELFNDQSKKNKCVVYDL